MRRIFTALALTLAIAACGDSPSAPEPDPTLDGRWVGTASGVTMDVTLNENDTGDVTGSGTLSGSTSIAMTITGTHTYPNVSFTAHANGYEDMNFTGKLAAGETASITGTLNGSGFNNFALTLRAQ